MDLIRGGHYLTSDESVDPQRAFLILFARGATMDRFDHTIGTRLALADDRPDDRTWRALKLLEDQMSLQRHDPKIVTTNPRPPV